MTTVERGLGRKVKTDNGDQTYSPWLTPEAAAEYYGVGLRTLELWRKDNTGPRFYRLGPRFIRYKVSDLDAFLAAEQ